MMIDFNEIYSKLFSEILQPLSNDICLDIKDNLAEIPRIDQIVARAKSVESFVGKAHNKKDGKLKYADPLIEIQDQIGVRIVTFFESDVKTISQSILDYYRHAEDQSLEPESEKEFGYFGRHFILLVPEELKEKYSDSENVPIFFELQVKTLFQHAWGQADHDLGYKTNSNLSKEMKRKIAFSAAQAWGADKIFEELFQSSSGFDYSFDSDS